MYDLARSIAKTLRVAVWKKTPDQCTEWARLVYFTRMCYLLRSSTAKLWQQGSAYLWRIHLRGCEGREQFLLEWVSGWESPSWHCCAFPLPASVLALSALKPSLPRGRHHHCPVWTCHLPASGGKTERQRHLQAPRCSSQAVFHPGFLVWGNTAGKITPGAETQPYCVHSGCGYHDPPWQRAASIRWADAWSLACGAPGRWELCMKVWCQPLAQVHRRLGLRISHQCYQWSWWKAFQV